MFLYYKIARLQDKYSSLISLHDNFPLIEVSLQVTQQNDNGCAVLVLYVIPLLDMMYQSDVLLTFTVYRSDLFQHKVYDGWFLNFDVVFYCPCCMCLDQIVHACCIISPTHCITNATRQSLYYNIATIYTASAHATLTLYI